MIKRTDRHQTFTNGQLVDDVAIEVDITADVVTLALHARARQALTDNGEYLALTSPTAGQTVAQTKRLTRQCSALIRLLIGADLLDDTATDT